MFFGENEGAVTVVECEAFRERQKKNLEERFKETLILFPSVKRILCIPQIVELEEIWVVDINSGKLIQYRRS